MPVYVTTDHDLEAVEFHEATKFHFEEESGTLHIPRPGGGPNLGVFAKGAWLYAVAEDDA